MMMMMMLRPNCLVWSKVGRGCSGFEIELDAVYGEVGVTFWFVFYSRSSIVGFSLYLEIIEGVLLPESLLFYVYVCSQCPLTLDNVCI
jgi:hypothetical protein